MTDLCIRIKKKSDKLDGTCSITDDELRHVREKRRELLAQWATLPAGETLELHLGQPTGNAQWADNDRVPDDLRGDS